MNSPISQALFLQILQFSALDIFKYRPQCSVLILVSDAPEGIQEIRLHSSIYSLKLLVPVKLNSTLLSPDFTYPSKFSRPCSVVLHDISNEFPFEMSEDEDEEPPMEWPEAKFPGYPHLSFQILFTSLQMPIFTDTQLLNFAKTTRKIRGVYFLLLSQSNYIQVYTLSLTGDSLNEIWSSNSRSNSFFGQNSTEINYQGATMTVNICARCGRGTENFLKTGIWTSYVEAPLWELVACVNGTLEYEKIFSLVRASGQNEEGEWDGWVQPLIDGTAAIATLQSYSTPGRKVLLYSRVANFEYACFITAKPKRLEQSQDFIRLFSPLSPFVWVASLVSIVLLFLSIELSILFHKKLHTHKVIRPISVHNRESDLDLVLNVSGNHSGLTTFGALFRPITEQESVTATFQKVIQNDHQSKLLLSLWLLTLIVVIAEYTSMMTSHLVLPLYNQPPSTFEELAFSNYKRYAVLWTDNLEDDFKALDNEVGRIIVTSTKEYSYTDDTCFVAVVEGDNACIGYLGALRVLGPLYLVDVHGNPRYIFSKELLFPRVTNYAISKLYAPLQPKMDFLLSTFESSGITAKWTDNQYNSYILEGRRNAIRSAAHNSGNAESENREDGVRILRLIMKVISRGLLFASFAFVCEISSRWCTSFGIRILYRARSFCSWGAFIHSSS